jgi:hypothetical protein
LAITVHARTCQARCSKNLIARACPSHPKHLKALALYVRSRVTSAELGRALGLRANPRRRQQRCTNEDAAFGSTARQSVVLRSVYGPATLSEVVLVGTESADPQFVSCFAS